MIGDEMMDKRIYAALTAMLLFPSRALAAPEEGGGILPPMLVDMLVMLALVLGVLLLIAVAYLWASLQQVKEETARIPKLAAEVKSLAQQIEPLKKQLMQEEEIASAAISEAPPPLPQHGGAGVQPMDKKIWQAFVDDYNKLAKSMDVPKALEACERFVQTKQLALLICLEPAAMDGSVPMPKFAEVDGVGMASFWAWESTEKDARYAVVPNLVHPYDKQLHEAGGMKETFASNFEGGVYSHMEVKLPAIFRKKDGRWLIEQPGLIRLQQ